eukprot:4865575-Pleurochrysis_carterae.AAC.1
MQSRVISNLSIKVITFDLQFYYRCTLRSRVSRSTKAQTSLKAVGSNVNRSLHRHRKINCHHAFSVITTSKTVEKLSGSREGRFHGVEFAADKVAALLLLLLLDSHVLNDFDCSFHTFFSVG